MHGKQAGGRRGRQRVKEKGKGRRERSEGKERGEGRWIREQGEHISTGPESDSEHRSRRQEGEGE